MGVTLDLPETAIRRLEAEAQRRGVAIAEVIADLAAQLPEDHVSQRAKRRLAFVAVGASEHGITTHMEERLAEGFGRD
jgi:hypothetical protein